ncbi:hypothetical protein M885DRAFT_516473 [Pelagophyceae sp. CCMP2097]|nr:hypothetical protein M885DRAFT_516473 [Pelagophyceae sp. CCMP2097]|mmetsp:Transcript_9124/g.30163  ORF Transcript_9124/g.30163 Transcript_9124/m.30163 type:complete len:161 (+) Transcript_9124:2-484(+)
MALRRGLPGRALWRGARRFGGPAAAVRVTVRLPEGSELTVSAVADQTLLEALQGADLSDVWPGGACGGSCSCSTCRVAVDAAPQPLEAPSEGELDMLDTAATALSMQWPDASAKAEAFRFETSRLACQVTLRPGDDGLVVALPEDVCNVLEVPLWLRGSR